MQIEQPGTINLGIPSMTVDCPRPRPRLTARSPKPRARQQKPTNRHSCLVCPFTELPALEDHARSDSMMADEGGHQSSLKSSEAKSSQCHDRISRASLALHGEFSLLLFSEPSFRISSKMPMAGGAEFGKVVVRVSHVLARSHNSFPPFSRIAAISWAHAELYVSQSSCCRVSVNPGDGCCHSRTCKAFPACWLSTLVPCWACRRFPPRCVFSRSLCITNTISSDHHYRHNYCIKLVTLCQAGRSKHVPG